MRFARTRRFLCPLLAFLAVGISSSAEQRGSFRNIRHFGNLGPEEKAEHVFLIRNDEDQVLVVERIAVPDLVKLAEHSKEILPGENGRVAIRLETPRPKGPYRGRITVHFQNEDMEPLVLWVAAEIVDPIEFDPFPAVYLRLQRGQTQRASVEVINHELEPLEIMHVEHASSVLEAEVETLEEGRRFRLLVSVDENAPAGDRTERVTLVTSSDNYPFLDVKVRTIITERLYANPREIDFGTISIDTLKVRPRDASLLQEAITVIDRAGGELHVRVGTSAKFLRLSEERLHGWGKVRFQVAVEPTALKAGQVEGSVVVLTNDPEFPQLIIPIKAKVTGHW